MYGGMYVCEKRVKGRKNLQPPSSENLDYEGEEAADDQPLVLVEEGGFVFVFDGEFGVGLAGFEEVGEDCGRCYEVRHCGLCMYGLC